MKIIGIYESKDTVDGGSPRVMGWPDSVMIRTGKPLFLPGDDCFIHPALGIRIDAVGKTINPKYALRYYNETAPMAFVFNEEVSRSIMNREDPCAYSIMSDYSIICGKFIGKEILSDSIFLETSLSNPLNGQEKIEVQINVENPAETIARAVSVASRRNTLKTGDMLAVIYPQRIKAEVDTVLHVGFGKDMNLLENKLK